MTERTLSTKKLISQSYLGNETEEDAIYTDPTINQRVYGTSTR